MLTNGASASNIFWAVAGAVTLGTFSTFEGNILTGATSHIAIQTGAVLNGRALSDGAVTLDANKVTTPSAIATFDIILTADDDADSWNFVSFNIIPVSTSLETILDDISGSYDKVMYYDAATDEWNSYVPGRAEHFNNLADWNHHMGLWIHATVNDTLTVTGTVPASTDITLYPGWNMVGLPSTSAGNHGLPVEVTRIGYFNATTEYNVAYDYEPWNYTFEASKGYWIHNPTAGNLVWTVNY